MIRGQIIITFKDGRSVEYANRFLAEKTGTDEAGIQNVVDRYGREIEGADGKPLTRDVSLPLFAGYPGASYYYTGFGNDTYDKQTGPGKIKGDYEKLLAQIGGAGKLKFPEADENHGDTEILERRLEGGGFSRRSFNAADVVSVSIKEDWVRFPYGRLSGYTTDQQDPNFLDFNETEERKLKGYPRGPDFDAGKRYDNGYIQAPIIESGKVVNSGYYDELVADGESVYGVKNGRKSARSYF